MNNSRTRLRELLASSDCVVAPGAYDGATAKLVKAAGFEAVYMTGAGVSATYGLPDYGLIGLAEMSGHAERIVRSACLPTIVDADTGYGNELNVTHTVQVLEHSGVAALHIEDQVSPKRCGHLVGKEVISIDEFVAKIRAAVAARRDPDLVIIARTDARGVTSFDDAIERANAAVVAGADMAFVEAVRSIEEAADVCRRVDAPCLLNMVKGGVTPVFDVADAKAMGYKLVIAPALCLGTATGAVLAALRQFRETNLHPPLPGNLTVAEIFELMGASQWDQLRLAS